MTDEYFDTKVRKEIKTILDEVSWTSAEKSFYCEQAEQWLIKSSSLDSVQFLTRDLFAAGMSLGAAFACVQFSESITIPKD